MKYFIIPLLISLVSFQASAQLGVLQSAVDIGNAIESCCTELGMKMGGITLEITAVRYGG